MRARYARRRSRFMRLRARRVTLMKLEKCVQGLMSYLHRHPDVKDVAVIGLPDQRPARRRRPSSS